MAIHLRTDHPFIEAFKKRRELEALELDARLAQARAPEVKAPKKKGGRPPITGKVMAEYEKRRAAERCKPTVEAEAEYLEAWRPKNAKKYKAPTARTIERLIREARRRRAAENGETVS